MTWAPTHRHVKRGTDYRVLGCGFMKMKPGLGMCDGSTGIVYLGENNVPYIQPWLPVHESKDMIGLAKIQVSGEPLKDGDAIVLYQGEDGTLWVRLFDEFMDGRFMLLKGEYWEQLWGHTSRKYRDVLLVLQLFREFAIKNATQWKLGSNHHHPVWALVAETLGNTDDIRNGPLWKFIQPTNETSLEDLLADAEKEPFGSDGIKAQQALTEYHLKGGKTLAQVKEELGL